MKDTFHDPEPKQHSKAWGPSTHPTAQHLSSISDNLFLINPNPNPHFSVLLHSLRPRQNMGPSRSFQSRLGQRPLRPQQGPAAVTAPSLRERGHVRAAGAEDD